MRAPHAAHDLAAFNPVLECSGTGLKAAKSLPNEALSLAAEIIEKGASILFVKVTKVNGSIRNGI